MNTTKRIIQGKASSNESPWSSLLRGLWRMSLGLKAFYQWHLQELQFQVSPLLLIHCVKHSRINWKFKDVDGKLTENYKVIWKIAFYYQKKKWGWWTTHSWKKPATIPWLAGIAREHIQTQPARAAAFLETLKKSFFPYFIDRRVWLNKRLEQTCIIWSQVKNTSFLPKKSADISVLSSSDFRFESPLCSLGNHHMNTWIMQHFQLLLTRGTAQGLEAKGVGTLTYQKDGKI